MSHFRTECSCGRVIAQCRCMDPAKTVTVRPHPACERSPMRTVEQRLEGPRADQFIVDDPHNPDSAEGARSKE